MHTDLTAAVVGTAAVTGASLLTIYLVVLAASWWARREEQRVEREIRRIEAAREEDKG